MALRDLDELGLLLPRDQWGHTPSATRRTAALTVMAALLGIASGLLVWFGAGGVMTFLGIGLFMVDLGAFLWVTFLAVEDRMSILKEMGADEVGV